MVKEDFSIVILDKCTQLFLVTSRNLFSTNHSNPLQENHYRNPVFKYSITRKAAQDSCQPKLESQVSFRIFPAVLSPLRAYNSRVLKYPQYPSNP